MQSLLQGSPPFSLGPDDWRKLVVSFLLALIGGATTFITGQFLPTLSDSAQNETGLLIVAVLTTVLPFVANFLRKWLGDTRPLVIGFVALTLAMSFGSPAMAWELKGASAAVANGTVLDFITGDPLTFSAILIGVCLIASKGFKVDLSKFIVPIVVKLLNSVLAPPTTTNPPPTTTNTAPDWLALIQQIISQLNRGEVKSEDGKVSINVTLNKPVEQ